MARFKVGDRVVTREPMTFQGVPLLANLAGTVIQRSQAPWVVFDEPLFKTKDDLSDFVPGWVTDRTIWLQEDRLTPELLFASSEPELKLTNQGVW